MPVPTATSSSANHLRHFWWRDAYLPHSNHAPGGVGTRPVSVTPPEALEVTGSVGGSQGEQVYISQTPMDMTASSPQAVGEAGGLPRLPSGPHSQTEDRHLDTFQQKRHLARTGWHDPHRHDPYISQELSRKGEQRDLTVNKA